MRARERERTEREKRKRGRESERESPRKLPPHKLLQKALPVAWFLSNRRQIAGGQDGYEEEKRIRVCACVCVENDKAPL